MSNAIRLVKRSKEVFALEYLAEYVYVFSRFNSLYMVKIPLSKSFSNANLMLIAIHPFFSRALDQAF